MEVFILADTDTCTDNNTNTDANGLQTHFVGVSVCVGVGQCEHSIVHIQVVSNNCGYVHVYTLFICLILNVD